MIARRMLLTAASVFVLLSFEAVDAQTSLPAASGPASMPAGPAVAMTACMPDAADYTLLWWANGWIPRKEPVSPQILCVQTGRYGLAVDVTAVQVIHFGAIANPRPYSQAVSEDNQTVLALPPASLELTVLSGGREYKCYRGAVGQKDNANFPVRLIDGGRFVQRFDILQLEFEDKEHNRLKAEGRLEVTAWPDRLGLSVELTPREDLPQASLQIVLRQGKAVLAARAWQTPDGKFAVGKTQTVGVSAGFGPARQRDAANEPLAVEAENLSADKNKPRQPLKVDYDDISGCYRVMLPRDHWSVESQPDRMMRMGLRVSNPGPVSRPVRLMFDLEGSVPGITGFTPMLRDEKGRPSGIAVQLSKNWHRKEGRKFLYEGPWFHGYTLLRIPPGVVRGEFDIAFAHWGGVAAASHAQLCLIGWGWNQLWDQSAIGSWGENICYEPDGVQVRCMIDDVRPLMVWAMTDRPKQKWTWTNNVGGGDFLVYYDANNQYQHLVRMKAAYDSHGPNLTDVTYAGVTADGCIAARINVSLPRCDDMTRAYHSFRYDVLKPTSFSRLAFYQVGSDGYHWHQYNLLARGNEKGLLEEWTPARGGKKYDRTGIACDGNVPWFSLHAAVPGDHGKAPKGAWANRGLVVRSWKARLGGKDVPPFASVFGTLAGNVPSANLELSAPPQVTQLLPGDYVEAQVELLILPMSADDYYGPNENLRMSLKSGGNTWKPVFRQAAGNSLKVRAVRGELLRAYPPAVKADATGQAEVEITGGLGYVPVTFAGLASHVGELWLVDGQNKSRVDQSVHGNDYWQCDYDATGKAWSVTYNVSLDTPGDVSRTVRLVFGRQSTQ